MFKWLKKKIKSSLLHLLNLQIFINSLRLSKIMVIIIYLLIIIKEADIFSNHLKKMMFLKRSLHFHQYSQRPRIKIYQSNKIAKLNHYLMELKMIIKILLTQTIFSNLNLFLKIHHLKIENSKNLNHSNNILDQFHQTIKIKLVYKI